MTLTFTSVAPRVKIAPAGRAHVIKVWGDRSIKRPVHRLDETNKGSTQVTVTVTDVMTTTATVSVKMPCEATDVYFFVGPHGETVYLNQKTPPTTRPVAKSTATLIVSPVPIASSSQMKKPQLSSVSEEGTTTVVVITTIEQTVTSTVTVSSTNSGRIADHVLAMSPKGWNQTSQALPTVIQDWIVAQADE